MAVLLLCATVHEVAHAVVSTWLGDKTAKKLGRITLNPLKHIDPIGMLMIAIAGFGWFKPVPVNFLNLNRPKVDMAFVALAGPVSNVLFAFFLICIHTPILFATNTHAFGIYFWVSQNAFVNVVNEVFFLSITMNLGLALFNMLPIPPLDGHWILSALLPERLSNAIRSLGRHGFLIIILLIYTGAFRFIDRLIFAMYRGMFSLTANIFSFMQ